MERQFVVTAFDRTRKQRIALSKKLSKEDAEQLLKEKKVEIESEIPEFRSYYELKVEPYKRKFEQPRSDYFVVARCPKNGYRVLLSGLMTRKQARAFAAVKQRAHRKYKDVKVLRAEPIRRKEYEITAWDDFRGCRVSIWKFLPKRKALQAIKLMRQGRRQNLPGYNFSKFQIRPVDISEYLYPENDDELEE